MYVSIKCLYNVYIIIEQEKNINKHHTITKFLKPYFMVIKHKVEVLSLFLKLYHYTEFCKNYNKKVNCIL